MKIVINRCFGGFSLSKKAYEYLGLEWDGYGYMYSDYEDRANPELVEVVEELGEDASGDISKLKVVEIPDDMDWIITDYDGIETIEENHRSWS